MSPMERERSHASSIDLNAPFLSHEEANRMSSACLHMSQMSHIYMSHRSEIEHDMTHDSGNEQDIELFSENGQDIAHISENEENCACFSK